MLNVNHLSELAAGLTVLYVEDDEFLQEETAELLSNFFAKVTRASDGKEGLARFREQACDLVITDINMPNLNGLDMLREILAQNPNQMAMVISAHDETPYLMEMLRLGIRHYISKPLVLQSFLEVLQRVCAQLQEEREARQETEQSWETLRLLQQGTFRFRTPQEVKHLCRLLARLFPQPNRALTGLKELCLNAVEHGNLAISYEEKTAFHENDTLEQEIESRLQSTEYGCRTAEVECACTAEYVEIIIRDQGAGFAFEKFLQMDPERLFHSHGRGIAMSNALSFDELEYLGKGNVVRGRTWREKKD